MPAQLNTPIFTPSGASISLISPLGSSAAAQTSIFSFVRSVTLFLLAKSDFSERGGRAPPRDENRERRRVHRAETAARGALVPLGATNSSGATPSRPATVPRP